MVHMHRRGIGRAGALATLATVALVAGAAPFTAVAQTPTVVEWFVGLGTGGNPEQFGAEQGIVSAFNGSQTAVKLSLTVVQNDQAYDALATRIATGNPPDIIGPIGIRALAAFGDQLLDLKPYITSGALDLTGVEQGLVDIYNVGGKQIGVPYAVYPSYIYYNKDLFKEAGLAEPPHKVGDLYEGKPWDLAAVADLAKKLTVDTNGNDATSADFDPTTIDQFGFDFQWTDPRGWVTALGGSGSAVADDGKTAQWPDNWKKAIEWYYDGLWTSHFIPTQDYITALAGGNTFQSGKVAMDISHTWYTCCINPASGDPSVPSWDIAVPPIGVDGKVTAKLHADTMGVLATSKNPDAAVAAISFITTSPAAAIAYGALPADPALRQAFFDAENAKWAPLVVDWQVASDMLGFSELPNHEANMPNFLKSDAAIKSFQSKILTTGGLDIDAEIASLVAELQSDFDAQP